MINLIQTNQKFPGDIIDDIKKGKIHVVCMGQNGLTHLNVYAELYCKLDKDFVNKVIDLVNSSKETGTLFPKANISIIPKSVKSSDWNLNARVLTYEELKICIEDVFKANEEYLKSEIIYFTLERSYVDTSSAFKIVEDIIESHKLAPTYVKTVWFER